MPLSMPLLVGADVDVDALHPQIAREIECTHQGGTKVDAGIDRRGCGLRRTRIGQHKNASKRYIARPTASRLEAVRELPHKADWHVHVETRNWLLPLLRSILPVVLFLIRG
jgi:hypothetical protein